MQTIAKLALKSMGVDVPIGGGEFIGKNVALMKGRVSGYKTKLTTFGESKAFSGTFFGVNMASGEVYEANTFYAPNADYGDMIAERLDKLEPGQEMDFEFEVQVAKSEKAARGYAFVCREISTPEVIDAKAQMAAALVSKYKALPAPTETSAESAPKGGKGGKGSK